MMLPEITIEYEVDGIPTEADSVSDDYLSELLAHSGEQIRAQVSRKLNAARCPEHDHLPRVTVTAQYDTGTEQMELSYHVDSCCQNGLLRAVSALNRQG
ncbi:MAG: hypothetical protein J0M33_04615 [Anaerolineae bacterium]|nr:hypothetical protein [Anaerolineae bacterium]